ncbi:MAG TPA: hypothetical protein VIM33_12415 [Gaiellaceae bacterium]|jgi:hypothetical protein
MKARVRGEAGWRREAEILGHELIGLIAYPQVTDFLAASRSARTLGEHVELQQKLANANLEARHLDREVNGAKDRLREELLQVKEASDQERVVAIGRMLSDHDLTLAANQRRRYALRVVQDGIIWRLFGFDRHRIAILGEGTPVNYPSASFESEAAAAEEHWNDGRLAVFCDLSNCIRTGDLLVFDPPLVNVIEVKESDSSDDDSPQMQRARVRVEYLNTGRSETLAPNAPLVVTGHRDAPALRTNLSVLADLLEKARRQGWAASRAGDGAAVVALDMRGVPEDGGAVERAQRYERRFINGLGRLWRDPPTYEWNSSDRVLRDAKNAIAATAPFSILPLDPEDCAALALGFASWGKTKTSTKSGQPQPHRSSSVSAHGCGLGSWGDRLLELWRRESFREEVLWRLRKRARFGLFFLRRL